MKLAVIVGSTRQNRQTLKQAKWVVNTAQAAKGAEVELVDLADYNMPFFAEAASPRYNPNREVDEVAQKWLTKLDEFDAYVFVTPEYNHSITGVLKNALDFVDFQLNRKAAAVVSHGAAGGTRAAIHLKEILSESKTVVIPNTVAFSGMSDAIDEHGILAESLADNPWGPQAALHGLLDELQWYSDALTTARTAVAEPALA